MADARYETQGAGNGAQGRNRTTDTAIFSRMLYQLSYLGSSSRGGLEVAVYSQAGRRCPPRFAFGFARRGHAPLPDAATPPYWPRPQQWPKAGHGRHRTKGDTVDP